MGDLLALAAELVAIPSVSLSEAAIADRAQSILSTAPWLEVTRVGDNVVARTQFGLASRVLFAGHLDTVPGPDGEIPVPRLEDGALWGLGATDMKGGVAVMLDLATTVPAPSCDTTYVFYAAEEIARAHSGLLAVQRARPELLEADVAVVCEPTDGIVEAGCQGVLRAEVVLAGSRAHVARPWMGRNAIHRAGPLLGLVAGQDLATKEIDGCTYRESLQVVRISGGTASNVVPDRATVELNYRFAPDQDVGGATTVLAELLAPLLDPGDTFQVVDSAPAALPSLRHPKLSQLVERSGRPPVAKLGWTDVAFFAEHGVPATNFGPGNPELAHTPGEFVTRQGLEHARTVLGALLAR